jgi:ribonuclease J
MKIMIHRGGNEIGGNAIEIVNGNYRILLDCGLPLEEEEVLVDRSYLKTKFDAVFISHAHPDHYGLLTEIDTNIPVYCSEVTNTLFEVNELFTPQEALKCNFQFFQAGLPTMIGTGVFQIKITPFVQDHSAYDAHGFLIEAGNRTIVYSGDFRGHGRKEHTLNDLKTLLSAKKVDLLLMEGTNLSRVNVPMKSESDIEKELHSAISSSAKMVNVFFSLQNIDRLISMYRAALQNERQLVVDLYGAYILEQLSRIEKSNSLQSISEKVNVYYPIPQMERLKRLGRWDVLDSFRHRRLFLSHLKRNPQKYVLLTRSTLTKFYRDLEIDLLIYSAWEGYKKESASTQMMMSWYANRGVRDISIHTSGHASLDDYQRFIDVVNPDQVRLIHSDARDCAKIQHSDVAFAKNGDSINLEVME